MAAETLAQVPRKGRETKGTLLPLQAVLGGTFTILLLWQAGSMLVVIALGVLVTTLLCPYHDVEIGLRGLLFVRFVVWGRRTVDLDTAGAVAAPQPRPVRVVRRTKGWRFEP